MQYGAASEAQVAQFAADWLRMPVVRQQKVLGAMVEERDRMFGTPLDNLKVYAESNDPHGFVRDVLDIEPTQQQDEILGIFEKKDDHGRQVHRRILVHSGTDIGKTLMGACWVLYRAFAVSQLPDPDQAWKPKTERQKRKGPPPQGCIVLLPGPDHATIADTAWREILRLMDRAADQGFPFKTMFGLPPKPTKADWKPTAGIFFRAMAPPKTSKTKAIHSMSGRHNSNMISMCEEGSGVDDGVLNRIETGFRGENNVSVIHLNPDTGEPCGAAYARYQGAAYLNINLNALDFPNVIERRTAIGSGACTYASIDDAVRDDCEDLGQRPPEKSHHDIRYALKGKDDPERGPRDDGQRGMAGADVRTYRPNADFVAGVTGEFPVGYGDCPFDVGSLTASVRRWEEGENPDRLPDRWGIDPAMEGPDTAAAAPAWGPSLDELWFAVWDRPKEIPALIEAGGYEADGEWVVVEPIRIGTVVSLGSGKAHVIADEAQSTCGRIPVVCDRGGEGNAVFEHMDHVLGMSITPVRFGEEPERLLPSETPAFNRRVQLYLRFADLIGWGLVDLPPSEKIRQAALAQQKDYNHDIYRQVPGSPERVKVVKLLPKRKIRAAAGGGLDDFEACILACQAVNHGGWEMSTL